MSEPDRDAAHAPQRRLDPRRRRKEREQALRREDGDDHTGWWLCTHPIEALLDWLPRLRMRRDDEAARRRIAQRVEARRRRRGGDTR